MNTPRLAEAGRRFMMHRYFWRGGWIFDVLMAWLVLGLVSGGAAPAKPAPSDPAQSAIPWNELGAKATAQYSGDGLAVNPTATGARLRCAFQKLEGEVTPQGLWLSSTTPGSSNAPFRVVATAVGRDGGPRKTLPSSGVVNTAGGLARFIRPGLVEEYSVSVDGLRQDFILPERPAGEGALRVELKVSGAQAEASSDGTRLVLEGTARKLNYHRLRATDATGRELAAWMELLSPAQLAVVVEDGGAIYPVRIDPTFSDANWISMGSIGGPNGRVNAAVVDGSGNLYIGGNFTIAGDVFATNIAKWTGSSWSALGLGVGNLYNRVYALAVSGNELYVGGDFTTAGGSAANFVAKWNGSSWTALGSGMNSIVWALAVSGSDLYAGGSARTAGARLVNSIAKWNGSSWSTLGSGLNSDVYALAVSGSELYAGGDFTNAGGSSANHIAKWNGSSWSALGSGMNRSVHALAVSSSDLYAGGQFTTAGGSSASSIAKWDGSSWSALGSGMDWVGTPIVYALAVLGSDLYAGGQFTSPGNYIAKWNGSSWSALDSGANDVVRALAVSDSDLYAAGNFMTTAAARYIAKWNGGNWSALGSGMDDPVYALAVSGSDLYAGVLFRATGGNSANYIAKWNGSNWTALGSGMNHLVYALAQTQAVSRPIPSPNGTGVVGARSARGWEAQIIPGCTR